MPFYYLGEWEIECPKCGYSTIKKLSVVNASDNPRCMSAFCSQCHVEYNIVFNAAKCLLCDNCKAPKIAVQGEPLDGYY